MNNPSKHSNNKSVCVSLLVLIMIVSLSATTQAQTAISVSGSITDAVSGEGLPGATVRLVGTNYGAASDIEGNYRINRVAYGEYEVEVRYLGYRTLTATLTVNAQNVRQDFELVYEVIEGSEILIQAQAAGQAAALNQQRSSNTIVNVVSSDRIREFPDQNAAESIGRLPGISIQRDAGEGQKVVVRGLSPRFNSITVNGERIPSTDGNDRSVDLSMISPDILAGIEVFKAITPDMDADAIGGTVNLVVARAPSGFRADFRGQLGYNSHESAFGLPRGSLNISNRFFENRLGVLISANAQQAIRSSDNLTADYDTRGTDVVIEDMNLSYVDETRNRYGTSVSLDYDITDNHSIFASSFFSNTSRELIRQRKRYRVSSTRVEYDLTDRTIESQLWTNSFRGRHNFAGIIEADWQLSLSRTNTDEPNSHYSRFQELAAYSGTVNDTQGPAVIPPFALNNIDATWFQYSTVTSIQGEETDRTASLNFKVPYRLLGMAEGYFKFGAKYRTKQRTRDNLELRTPFNATNLIGQQNPDKFELYRNTNILMANFIDPKFNLDKFMNGDYDISVGLDARKLRQFQSEYLDRYIENRYASLSDYTAEEDIFGVYLMTELKLADRLMILPGVRFEETTNNYRATIGELSGDLGIQGATRDSIGGRTYSELLPMVHVQFKVTDNFDIRLAYTHTLSRPNYESLAPFRNVNQSERIAILGNPDTKHTRATNYDLFLSYYSNRIGFLSAGAFYKDIRDIDYLKQIRETNPGEFLNYRLTMPTNADESWVRGFELEWQSNLSRLPKPFNGLLFSVNYARIWSETKFPFFEIGPRSPDPPFRPIIIDTFRTASMPGQTDNIVNMSIGYEIKGFSARVSMIYYGESLEIVGNKPEADGYSDDYFSWDISLNQRLPFKYRTSVFMNLNNLANRPEGAYLGSRTFVTQEQYFGWTGDLGLRVQF